MVQPLPTIAIDVDGVRVLINEADFDEATHAIWLDEAALKAKLEAEAQAQAEAELAAKAAQADAGAQAEAPAKGKPGPKPKKAADNV